MFRPLALRQREWRNCELCIYRQNLELRFWWETTKQLQRKGIELRDRNSQTARKLGRSFFSRSASRHFIHRVPSKSQKLNVVQGHHCRDSDCLFKANLPFWLSPETMFPIILHI